MSLTETPIPLVAFDTWNFDIGTLDENGDAVDLSDWVLLSAQVTTGRRATFDVDVTFEPGNAVVHADEEDTDISLGALNTLTIKARSPSGDKTTLISKVINGVKSQQDIVTQAQFPGLQGAQGEDGKSAYQSAIDTGAFVGTEAEWAAANEANTVASQAARDDAEAARDAAEIAAVAASANGRTYASTSAAQADGTLANGSYYLLTDGSLYLKVSSSSSTYQNFQYASQSDVTNKVSKTGDESIAGVKTFTTSAKLYAAEYASSITSVDGLRQLARPGAVVESTSGSLIQAYRAPDGRQWLRQTDTSLRDAQRQAYVDPATVPNRWQLQISNVRPHPKGIVASVADRHGEVDCIQMPKSVNPRETFVSVPVLDGYGLISLLTAQSWGLGNIGGLSKEMRALYPCGVFEASAEASSYSHLSQISYPNDLNSHLLADYPNGYFDQLVPARSGADNATYGNQYNMLEAWALYDMQRRQGRAVDPIFCWTAAQGATSLADMDGSDTTEGTRSLINYRNAVLGAGIGARLFAKLGIPAQCRWVTHIQGAQGASESSPGVPDYTGWKDRMTAYVASLRTDVADAVLAESTAVGPTATRCKPVVFINQVPVSQTATGGPDAYQPLAQDQTELPRELSTSQDFTATSFQTVFDTTFSIDEADDLRVFRKRNGDSQYRPVTAADGMTITAVTSFPGTARITFDRGQQINTAIRALRTPLVMIGPMHHAALPIADVESGALDDNIHHSNVGRMMVAATNARVVDLVVNQGIDWLPLKMKVGGAIRTGAYITVEFECSLFDYSDGIDRRISFDPDWMASISKNGFRYKHDGGDVTINSVGYAPITGTAVNTVATSTSGGNITLSGEQSISGVNTSSSRVLLTAQTDPKENGVYVSSSGSWSRATDADTGAELYGRGFVVLSGSYAGITYLVQNATIPTVGSDSITISAGPARQRNKLLITLASDPGSVTGEKLRLARDNLTQANGWQAYRTPVMIEERGIKALYADDGFAYLKDDGTLLPLPQWVRHYALSTETAVS